MLNRYIGNKKAVLEPIIMQITKSVPIGGAVCDAFSGSLAVSLELKKLGYQVSTNDINLFSHFYGKHLIEQCDVPVVNLEKLDVPKSYLVRARNYIDSNLFGKDGYKFLIEKGNLRKYELICAVYLYLNDKSIEEKSFETFFFDTYTEDGKNSFFKSQRGSEGNRRFFTPSNGLILDYMMNKIRDWHTNGKLDGYFVYTLVCSVIDALEKVSNTQGTYHDFPRDKYDPRSLNRLVLIPPPYDNIISENLSHNVGKAEDSIEFVKKLPKQDLLYLDPPYNFRQYTSYYFLPNVLCEYIYINDLSGYFNKVEYVRGQNMSNDFISTFSKKKQFLESLEALIANCNTHNVLMSYFDGRNHWNNSTSGSDYKGRDVLSTFFRSKLFREDSFELIPFERLNYQSYGGHQAKFVNEFLFSGVKG